MRTVKRSSFILAVSTVVCGTLLCAALYLKTTEQKNDNTPIQSFTEQALPIASAAVASAPQIGQKPASVERPAAPAQNAFEKVQNAQTSNDPIEVFAALELAGSCQGVVNAQNDFLLFESGAPSLVTGELSDSRRSAIRRLFQYCNGFIRAGKVRTIELFKAINGRATAIGRELVTSSEVREKEISRGLLLINSGNPQAVEAGVTTLLKSVEIQGIQPESKDAEIASLAMLGVACDLNADCTADGLKMSTMCALSNVCNLNWLDFLKQDLNPKEKERFEALRAQYLAWLKKASHSEGNALSFTPMPSPH